MDKINIMLVDTDEKYLMPIELKFIEKLDDKLELTVISDEEYLRNHFSVPRQIDILVIKESLYDISFKKHNITNTFLLTEDMYTKDTTENLSMHMIYKYTSVKEIYNEVINKSLLETNSKGSESKIIMVYSPSGGVGKTTVSIGLASALNMAYKRVIYINTETLQSFNFIINRNEYCNSSNFEKLMINKNENIVTYLNEALGKEGFHYLLPFRQSLSSLNINIDEFIFLIDKLRESQLYDYIVIDTSSDFTLAKSKLMGKSDKVVIVSTQSKCDVSKLNSLRYNIDCSDSEKFIFICNKYNELNKNYLISDEYIKGINISEYIENLSEDKINIQSLSKNRSFVKLTYMFS